MERNFWMGCSPVKEEIQKIVSSNACLYISTFNDWVEAYNEKLLNYRIPVYIFVMFIGVFGIINLLNTLITNVLTRKRELGVLQAVGLSGKQLSNMLLMEGLFYTICVLILSILFGTVIGYLLIDVCSSDIIFSFDNQTNKKTIISRTSEGIITKNCSIILKIHILTS